MNSDSRTVADRPIVENGELDDSRSALDKELARSEHRLNQLVDAGRRLGSSLDRRTINAIMASVVEQAMPCEGFVVSSFDAEKKLITCEYAVVGGNVLDTSAFPPIELAEEGAGMQSTVIRTGRSMVFGDVQKKVHEPGGTYYDVNPDGESKLIEEEHEPQTQTAAMVPIKLEGAVVGVVQVSTHAAVAYSDEQVQLLEGLAQQLAIASQNAQLYERAQQEVTERRKAEAALQASEDGLWQTLDAMPQIAWSVHADGSVHYVNQRLLEYGGVADPEQTKGEQGWHTLVHPEDLGPMHARYDECFEKGVLWESELRLKRADGVYRWHLSRMVPIRDLNGEIVRWFGTSTDIHDLKEANTALQDLNNDLERRVADRTTELMTALREMEGFTYSVSHDLRGPLRTISATSKIVLAEAGEKLDDEMRDLLGRQIRAAGRLGMLIDALLKLSRISRYEMTKADVDVTEIAESVSTEIAGQEWPVAPEFKIQDGMRCLGDERLLRLVVHNIMENAVKFSPAGAKVEVGTTEDGAFFVRDTGVGFETKYSEKLWIPFERLVREDEFPGTGIGLANVKRIVDRHGGQVWAESTPGEGSTFFFTVGR